jgi:hypothetical protein
VTGLWALTGWKVDAVRIDRAKIARMKEVQKVAVEIAFLGAMIEISVAGHA